MKKQILFAINVILMVSLLGCEKCQKMDEQYIVSKESNERSIEIGTLGVGFLQDCSMSNTGSNDLFTVKIKIRGYTGLDANGNPTYNTFRSYLYSNISSNTNTSFTRTIEIPQSGAYFIDVVITSNLCVKCCSVSQNCQGNYGMVEFNQSTIYNGSVPAPNPIVFNNLVKTCY